MNLFIKSFLFSVTIISLSSCSKNWGELKGESPQINGRDLSLVVDSISKQKPDFFYAKIATDYKSNAKNFNCKTSVRMVQDSAISALFTYSTFPVINSISTKDSITIVDKKNNCFRKESLAMLKAVSGVDFSYANLEELILGLPIDFDTSLKYHQFVDDDKYYLSNFTKKEWKNRKNLTFKDVQESMYFTYEVNPDGNYINSIYIISYDEESDVLVNFKGRQEIEGFQIPQEVDIYINLRFDDIHLNLVYTKAELNQPQPLVLVIPEDYEKCE
jgi:hypothetical protein